MFRQRSNSINYSDFNSKSYRYPAFEICIYKLYSLIN